MNRNVVAIAIYLIGISSVPFLPAAELRGRVTQANSGQPLAGAVVFLSSGDTPAPNSSKPEPAELLIKGKKLVPQVLVVQTNQPFTIRDVDKFSYNFHVDFANNPKLNLALAATRHDYTTVAKNPELFARVWDDFSLLHGYVCVLENQPYAVTDSAGNYSIANLPPGRYTVTSAHWRTDRLTRAAGLSDGIQNVDFQLPPKFR